MNKYNKYSIIAPKKKHQSTHIKCFSAIYPPHSTTLKSAIYPPALYASRLSQGTEPATDQQKETEHPLTPGFL